LFATWLIKPGSDTALPLFTEVVGVEDWLFVDHGSFSFRFGEWKGGLTVVVPETHGLV
jgi:hypothetical protein